MRDPAPGPRSGGGLVVTRLPAVLALLILCLAGGADRCWAGSPDIEVEGLLKDAAILKIDGERKMLRVGQSHAGVTLIAAYSRTATLEVNGQQTVVGISRRIGANYEAPREQVVKIKRNAMLQYRTSATINGRSVQVMVDTGANVVALNSDQARAMGIDYKAGLPSQVETASGVINAWIVILNSVQVGGIRVDKVRASVLEGGFPATVLLGMSFLQHVDMSEKNDTLSLSRAW